MNADPQFETVNGEVVEGPMNSEEFKDWLLDLVTSNELVTMAIIQKEPGLYRVVLG